MELCFSIHPFVVLPIKWARQPRAGFTAAVVTLEEAGPVISSKAVQWRLSRPLFWRPLSQPQGLIVPVPPSFFILFKNLFFFVTLFIWGNVLVKMNGQLVRVCSLPLGGFQESNSGA